MEAEIVDLRKLFAPPTSYRIPQFQRPYAWRKDKQWKPLWSDISTVAENYINGDRNPRAHFMGAIVLQQRPNSSGEPAKRLVVDGQQRLTTLQLTIRATEEELLSLADTSRAERLAELIVNPSSHWGGDPNNEPKIWQSNPIDQLAFQEAIRKDFADYEESFWAIEKAHEYFRSKISDWLNEDVTIRDLRAEALEETLSKYLLLAVINLDMDEKPHIIFETLNDRGEQLLQSDLIKNTVMYEADVIEDPDRARALWGVFNDRWWREETQEGRLSRIQLDRFLNYWVTKGRRTLPRTGWHPSFGPMSQTAKIVLTKLHLRLSPRVFITRI